MADMWQVVGQRQTSDITASGQFREVMEVTVEVRGGTAFTIKVPLEQYTEDHVRQLIEARVEQVVAVDNL